MKATILVLSAVVTAFTFTSFGAEPLLSPRAKETQIIVRTVRTQDYVAARPTLLSPRATENQIRVVKGTANEVSPAAKCRAMMIASPKAVAECSSHANMPRCAAMAVK